ncbi:hypothetical protein SKAU_G00037770 [Synaphobranchus kaupii]|uniref:Uncharacterized protein n=1 Tax=Synaphobranchus kaupii TaxID=118154 RepID=A0A9Q1GF41_SYNKA|nr:hypothetical protein SKAU_G00037770 [Synaphobranchus kaupii]
MTGGGPGGETKSSCGNLSMLKHPKRIRHFCKNYNTHFFCKNYNTHFFCKNYYHPLLLKELQHPYRVTENTGSD